MAVTFASALKYMVPSWLSSGDGGLALTAACNVLDDYLDRARQGLQARFPSRAGDDALALIGADRGLIRGLTETSAHYAARLQAWRYPRGHLVRGSAFALLAQISNYFGGLLAQTIDVQGTFYQRDTAATETFLFGVPWTWDTNPALGRFWVAIVPSVANGITAWAALGVASTWGGALGVANVSIGQQGVSPADVAAIRNLLNGSVPWMPAGAMCEWVIVNLNGSPISPDATWVNWSKNVAGTQVAARSTNFRYWSMNAFNNQYAGNAANWPTLYTEVAGTTYAGDATNWPATIRLLDDGDPTT